MLSMTAALLISSEIADINRFPDYEHLSSYAKLVSVPINQEKRSTQRLI